MREPPYSISKALDAAKNKYARADKARDSAKHVYFFGCLKFAYLLRFLQDRLRLLSISLYMAS
jgi:hypothetical protein